MKNIEITFRISLHDLMYDSGLDMNDIRKIEMYFSDVSELLYLLVNCFCISTCDDHYTFSALDLIQDELIHKTPLELFEDYVESAYDTIERYIDESAEEMDSDFAQNYINHYFTSVYSVVTALCDTFLSHFKKFYKQDFITIHNLKLKTRVFASNHVFYFKIYAYKISPYTNQYRRCSQLFRYNKAFDTEALF